MKTLKMQRPDGTLITTWEEWTRPKREYQWKAGRSAMELAKAWFRNGILSPPSELLSLLESHDRLKGIQFTDGIPELVTPLPERGEGRNHDLALRGHTDSESVTVCIEAKADEPFGTDTISDYLNKANKKREKGISTRVPERIESLLSIVDPDTTISDSKWHNIKYQLLTAICGTIIQAKIDGSTLAVLIIHEFKGSAMCDDKQAENHTNFEDFMSVLEGVPVQVESGRMYGMFNIGGMDCLIGKVVMTIY